MNIKKWWLSIKKQAMADTGVDIPHSLKVGSWKEPARMYHYMGDVYVAAWWYHIAPLFGTRTMVRWYRHELGHLWLYHNPGSANGLHIPQDYPEGAELEIRRFLSIFHPDGYASVHPEEAWCERLAELHPSTLRLIRRKSGR